MAPVPKSPFTLKASSHTVPPQAPSSPPRAGKDFWELNFKLPKHQKMPRSEWIMASTSVSALQVKKAEKIPPHTKGRVQECCSKTRSALAIAMAGMLVL